LFNDAANSYLDIDHGADGSEIKQAVSTKNILLQAGIVSGQLTFETGGSEAMRIDASQRVLIGDTTGRSGFGKKLEIMANDSLSSISLVRASNSTGASAFLSHKARGTLATPLIVQDDDNTLQLTAHPYDGTDYGSQSARISMHIDGTPGANDTPGRIMFETAADGASTVTERMRITNAGNVGIGETDPDTTLHVKGADNSIITIESEGAYDARLRILTPNDRISYIEFADADDVDAGEIRYDHTNDRMQFRTGSNTLVMTMDSSQRVLIAKSGATAFPAGLTPRFQQFGQTADTAALGIERSASSEFGPYIVLSKSRGTTSGSGTIVQDGDYTGSIYFGGADGTDQDNSTAAILSQVDGSPGTADMPGRLVFLTTPDGARAPTERMRINSSGFVKIGNAGDPETMLQVQYGSVTNGSIMIGANYDGVLMSNNTTKIGAIHHPHYNSSTYPKGFRIIAGYADSGNSLVQIGGGTSSAKAATQIRFYTGASITASTNSEQVRIDENGNIAQGNVSGNAPDAYSSAHGLTIIKQGTPKIALENYGVRAMAFHGPGSSSENSGIVIYDESGATEIARFRRGGGITFNGDTAAANALDDYEEGSWIPVVKTASAGSTLTYDTDYIFRSAYTSGSTNRVTYTKIGNKVFISFAFWSKINASYRFNISLPFAYLNSDYQIAGACSWYEINTAAGIGMLGSGGSTFDTFALSEAGDHNNVSLENGSEVYYNFSYETA